VNSYHHGYSWSDDLIKGEVSTILKTLPGCFFQIQNMDSKRFPDQNFLELTKSELRIRLQSFTPDLIIANDNAAADFVFKNRDEFFPGKPVVFCGLNGYEQMAHTIPSNVTGVAEGTFWEETVAMLLKLHPALEEVRIVSGGMGMGPIINAKALMLDELRGFKERVGLNWQAYSSFDQVVTCCADCPAESVILVGGFDTYERGAFYCQDEVVQLLTRIAPVPVYSLFHTGVERGAAGLGLISGELQGVAAGELAVRILKGEPASAIKVIQSVGWQPKFDASELKRWRVDRRNLPAGAVVVNQAQTFYTTYRRWIWLAFALILLQSILSILLVLHRTYQRMKRALSLSQTSLNSIMDSSPYISIIVTDADGRIELFNSGSEQMLGYRVAEVQGRRIVALLWSEEEQLRLRKAVSGESGGVADESALLRYIAAAGAQESDSVYRCQDGKPCNVHLAVSRINNEQGEVDGYLVVASDVTEKKRAQRQLEESQKFLRSVIDAMPVRIFWKDCHSVYLGCNNAFACDAGLVTTGEVVGRSDAELPWRGQAAKTFVEDDREVLTTQRARLNLPESVVTVDGSVMDVQTSKIPLFDLDNNVIGLLGMYENITDYKRMQEIVEKRIVSLTRCMDDPDTLEFEKLFSLNEIQRIQDEFSESTSVSSVIVRPSGEFITTPSRLTCLCRAVMGRNECCAECYRLTGGLANAGRDLPLYQRCAVSGLNMALSPIHVKGVHVASWILGQVRIQDSPEDTLPEIASRTGIAPAELLITYDKVPVMTREKFESVARSAHILCAQLSLFATQNIQQAVYIAEEKRQTEEIRKFSAAIAQIPDGVMILDTDHKIEYVNPSFFRITGYAESEAIGKYPPLLHSLNCSDQIITELEAAVESGKVWSGRMLYKRRDGSPFTCEVTVSPVVAESGKIVNFIATIRDVTLEIAREEELNHRQRMAAIGQLAGGVAHDFNNILQAILGFSELLLSRLAPETVEYQNVEQISAAAKKAVGLTRGLLALGRRDQPPENLDQVDLNHLLRECSLLLDLISTDKIAIEYALAPDLWPVLFTPDKFYQVLMNLVINARDAMPDGGRIRINSCNVTEADADPGHTSLSGDYVCLAVEDNGCGIDPAIQDKIFDPFFTTKDVGKGSGLGLSIVYANVRNFNGTIRVSSQPGVGTTFFVYLPKKTV